MGLWLGYPEWFGLFCIKMILEVAFEIKWLSNILECYFIELSPVLIGVPGLIFDFHFSCHSVAVLTFVVVDGCDTWHHHTWQLIVPRTTTGAATRCQGQHHRGKLLSICVSVPQGNHQEGHILKHFSSFNYFLTWVFPHFSAKGILSLFPRPPPVSEWLLG